MNDTSNFICWMLGFGTGLVLTLLLTSNERRRLQAQSIAFHKFSRAVLNIGSWCFSEEVYGRLYRDIYLEAGYKFDQARKDFEGDLSVIIRDRDEK